jgi:predicted nucleotidyltransferase
MCYNGYAGARSMNGAELDTRKTKLSGDPQLGRLVTLLQEYKPERIILVGSHARGHADEYSDYDIIVIKRTDRSFLERLQDMVPYLVQFERPADILVYTPDEFEQMGERGLGWIAQREGIVLYERQQ